jgi:hypothetical protein
VKRPRLWKIWEHRMPWDPVKLDDTIIELIHNHLGINMKHISADVIKKIKYSEKYGYKI